MALLDGKQLRNQSTELGKLSGSGIVSFTAATMSFTAGSVLTTATSNIVNPTDVVNKEYVDSVAAGLDPKESVAYTTTGNITLSGTETQANGDWSEALSAGDRILVKDQTDKTENGIYTAAAGGWSRASDHDGTPANEVTLGNFTFVEYGSLAGSGYVLHSTNSGTTPVITPGSDEQEWTLYSQAGAYTAGTGLNLNDGEFEIDATGVAAGSYGSADSTTTFTVNSEGQLTAAADTQISIIASQVTDFDLAAETAIFEDPNFVDGTTIEFDVTAGDSVTAEVSDSSLTSAKLDTGSNGGATAGYVLSVDASGDFKWILDEGDISGVEAGNGLIGGGTEGDVELNLGGTVDDDIIFDFGGTGSINFGNNGAGQNSETFSIGTKNFTAFSYNDLGLPASSLIMNNGNTSLAGDVINGSVNILAATVSLSGSYNTLIGPKSTIASTEVNVGDINGNTTDIKIKGDYTTVEGETLDITTNLVSIDSGTGPSQFLSGTDTTISASASLNLTAEEGNVTTGDGKGLQYTADYSSTFVDNSLVTKKYVDSLDAAQITGVSAGNGLLGGGTAGDVTLDLGGTVSSTIIFNFTQSSHIEFNGQQAFITDSAQYARTRVTSGEVGQPGYVGLGYNQYMATNSGLYMQGDRATITSTIGNLGLYADNGSIELGTGATVSIQGGTGYSAFNRNTIDGNYHIMNINQGASHSFGSTYSVGADVINITGASALNLSGEAVGITGGSVSLSHSSYDNNINSQRTANLTISASGSYLSGGTNFESGSLTLGGSGSSFVAGSMSIVSDNFNIAGTGASFSFDTGSGNYSNDFTINGSQSALSYSVYDNNLNSSRRAGLTLGASGSILSGGTNQESGTLTIGGSGSSFVAGSMSIVSDNFNLGGTGASFSFDNTSLVVGSSSVSLSGSTSSIVVGGTGISITGLASYTEDYSGQFGTNSLVTKAYVDSLDAAQITGVDAGNGLIGGGTAGTVELGLGGTVGDDIVFDFGASASINFGNNGAGQYADSIGGGAKSYFFMQYKDNGLPSGSLGILQNNTSLYSDVIDGTSTIGGATVSLIGKASNLTLGDSNTFNDGRTGAAAVGIEYSADYSANYTDRSLVDKAYADTKVSGVTAGAGLSGGGADGDITLNADLTIDGGLTFSSTGDAGTIEVVVDNTTIQVVDGALSVVAGTSQPVYQSATSSATNGDTGITLSSTPNDYSRIEVYVNGQLQNLTENTTGDCYFGAAGTVLTSLTAGDTLYWNSANAGFELSATDVIKVHYQA